MPSKIATYRTFEVDFDPDAEQLLFEFTSRDPFAIGLCTAYLSQYPESLLDLKNLFDGMLENDQRPLNNDNPSKPISFLIEAVFKVLLSDSPPVHYATLVLLSQCDEAYSESELNDIWKSMPWDDSYPNSISPLLQPLINIGFITQSKDGLSLQKEIKQAIFTKLSESDKQSAAVTLSNYFAKSSLPDEVKIPKSHYYLKKAGLKKESLQLAIAYSTSFVKSGKFNAAHTLISNELKDVDRENNELRVFLLHQLSVIDFHLQNFDDAIRSLHEVVSLLQEGDNLPGKLAAQSQLANLYAMRGDIEKSLTIFNDVLNSHQSLKNISGVVAISAQMGMIAFEQKNHVLAVEKFYLSKRLAEKLSDEEKNICKLNWEYLLNDLGEKELNRLLEPIKEKIDAVLSKLND